VRQPVIALLFQRGSFTAESTRIVSAVFLGFAPSLIGLSLLEISARSLFALERRWLPVMAASVPLLVNLVVCARLHTHAPEYIGMGASIGVAAGFAVLVVAIESRKRLAA
jgi:putative peptidoglycan lipid II flippase